MFGRCENDSRIELEDCASSIVVYDNRTGRKSFVICIMPQESNLHLHLNLFFTARHTDARISVPSQIPAIIETENLANSQEASLSVFSLFLSDR